MITLKTFDEMNISIKTEYNVFDSANNFIEMIRLDYLDEDQNRCTNAILKKNELIKKKAKVERIINCEVTGFLEVVVILN